MTGETEIVASFATSMAFHKQMQMFFIHTTIKQTVQKCGTHLEWYVLSTELHGGPVSSSRS